MATYLMCTSAPSPPAAAPHGTHHVRAVPQGCYLRRHLRELAARLRVKYEDIKLLEMHLGQAVPPRPRPSPPSHTSSFDEWAVVALLAEARMLV
jgi:hypothetical protein